MEKEDSMFRNKKAVGLLTGAVGICVLAGWAGQWRAAASQSCHICGARRVIIREFRWWQLSEETIEPVPGSPFSKDAGHSHDWWQYAQSHNSWWVKWGATNGNRYRDGRAR